MNLQIISQQYMLPILIGVCSSLATTYLKEYLNRKVFKLKRLEEKYQNFYLPFVDLYNTNVFGATNFTDFTPELQKEFYDMVTRYEYRYKDSVTYDLIYCFKSAFNMKFAPDFDQIMTYDDYVKSLNDNFNNLVTRMLDLQENAREELKY
ncbi:hypothetical protein [Peptostreptococcus sp. D1]|uniref:hypothetical protein n=1 Tax=Peptostreptococcus sp. D1 TaxID=72304 RepID=UPI0008EF72D8|nr:hypothetical protein [Peptostreptococcus sp. D1]SFE38939.1 hypothetical protein SAMN02910278_00757 [Peptostreptococcus sp. D1]